MYIKLLIYTNTTNTNKFKNINDILINITNNNIIDKNIIIKVYNSLNDSIKLYGYDKKLNYVSSAISCNEFAKISNIIKELQLHNKNMEIYGGNMELYTDNNPNTTLKGTGFKDTQTALKTLKLISNRSIIYQKAIINTLYYRAKHHPHKTKDIMDAMKIFKKWLLENKNKTIKYKYLDLHIVKEYEKLANYYDISHVARGLKKPTKTDTGFLVMYKKYGQKLYFIPIFKNKPNCMDYDVYREKFINSRLGQMKYGNIKLYNSDGLPTKQHVILIMHAYSPDPTGIKNKIKLLSTISKN